MARIILGWKQSIHLDGQVLEGTREFDVDVAGKTQDITGWNHEWSSTVVLSASATFKLLVYWQENFQKFANKFNKHPAYNQIVTLSVPGLITSRCVVTNVSVKNPMERNVSWEITLQSMVWGS